MRPNSLWSSWCGASLSIRFIWDGFMEGCLVLKLVPVLYFSLTYSSVSYMKKVKFLAHLKLFMFLHSRSEWFCVQLFIGLHVHRFTYWTTFCDFVNSHLSAWQKRHSHLNFPAVVHQQSFIVLKLVTKSPHLIFLSSFVVHSWVPTFNGECHWCR